MWSQNQTPWPSCLKASRESHVPGIENKAQDKPAFPALRSVLEEQSVCKAGTREVWAGAIRTADKKHSPVHPTPVVLHTAVLVEKLPEGVPTVQF